MLETPLELAQGLGGRVRARRLALGMTQVAAAARAGVAHRTWRRLEGEGRASVEDLVRAALALRCEQGLAELFPLPAATSMDALLAAQQQAAPKPRQRVRSAS